MIFILETVVERIDVMVGMKCGCLQVLDDGDDKGRRFKIKGKWDGIVTTDLYYNLYIKDTNELVESKIIS